jgi:hypothetical protein
MIDLTTLIDLANVLYAMVTGAVVSINPDTLLYTALGGTYGSAALAAAENDHHALCRCYVLSALLHELIGICHHLHM